MEYITCPNCKEKFKAEADRKYYDCPFCKMEFAERDLQKNTDRPSPASAVSLMDKIKHAQKNS